LNKSIKFWKFILTTISLSKIKNFEKRENCPKKTS
jgi:hypothetical protein